MKVIVLSLALFLTSCSFIFNPKFDPSSGCLLQKIELKDEKFAGKAGYVGYCIDESILARFEAEVEESLIWVQIVYHKDKRIIVSYRTSDGVWVIWSEKSGLIFDIPNDFTPENITNTVQ